MIKFYKYEIPASMAYAEGEVMCEPDFDNYDKCPLCGETVGSVYKKPYVIKLSRMRRGRPMPDNLCLWTNTPGAFSQKAVDAVEKHGITGIESFDKVDRFVYKKKTIYLSYYIPKVTRIDLPVDYDRSCISWLHGLPPHKTCPVCNPQPKVFFECLSLVFKTDRYNGIDIFKTYDLGNSVFCSQRFFDMVKTEELKNFQLTETRLLGAKLLSGKEYGDHGEKDEVIRNWLHLSKKEYYNYIESLDIFSHENKIRKQDTDLTKTDDTCNIISKKVY